MIPVPKILQLNVNLLPSNFRMRLIPIPRSMVPRELFQPSIAIRLPPCDVTYGSCPIITSMPKSVDLKPLELSSEGNHESEKSKDKATDNRTKKKRKKEEEILLAERCKNWMEFRSGDRRPRKRRK